MELRRVDRKALKQLSCVQWEYAAQIYGVSQDTLDNLEKSGLIERFTDGFIGDTIRYSITTEGRTALNIPVPKKRKQEHKPRPLGSRLGESPSRLK